MHPELINNSLFSKYFKQWQENPDSIVFAAIVEFFLGYNMVDEAFKICREGLKRHPTLVSGRMAMAKIHKVRGNWEEAEEELKQALLIAPENGQVKELLKEVSVLRAADSMQAGEFQNKVVFTKHSAGSAPEFEVEDIKYRLPDSWNTITMAGIYAAQGHVTQAKAIYKSILESDPTNESARVELERLPK